MLLDHTILVSQKTNLDNNKVGCRCQEKNNTCKDDVQQKYGIWWTQTIEVCPLVIIRNLGRLTTCRLFSDFTRVCSVAMLVHRGVAASFNSYPMCLVDLCGYLHCCAKLVRLNFHQCQRLSRNGLLGKCQKHPGEKNRTCTIMHNKF